MTAAILCDGVVALTVDLAPTCSTGWYSVAYDLVVPFDPANLVPGELAGAFGLGFFLSVTPIAAAYGARVLLQMIR